jgi:type IV pilus assembly protein PilW
MKISLVKKDHGYSLFELLLAIFLGSFLMVVVLQAYLGIKNTYRVTNDLAIFNENMRFAEYVLWQTITQAGFSGLQSIYNAKINDHVYYKPGEPRLFFGIHGYHSPQLPRYLMQKGIANGTDVIVVGKVGSQDTKLKNKYTPGTTSFIIAKPLDGDGEQTLLITDGVNADLFNAEIYNQTRVKTYTPLGHNYHINSAELRVFEEIAFFIKEQTGGKHDRPNHGLFFCTNRGRAEELVSNISDMQVFYGFNISGSLRYLKTDEVGLADWENVVNVRIDLTINTKLNLQSNKKHIYIKIRH